MVLLEIQQYKFGGGGGCSDSDGGGGKTIRGCFCGGCHGCGEVKTLKIWWYDGCGGGTTL